MVRMASSGLTVLAIAMTMSACTLEVPSPTSPSEPTTTAQADEIEPAIDPEPNEEPLVLPVCEGIYTAAQQELLMGPHLELSSPSGSGTNIDELDTLISANGGLSCTWILPASERGLSVSITTISETDRATVESTLGTAGFTSTPLSGTDVRYEFSEGFDGEASEDVYPYTEAHWLLNGAWVSVWDGSGNNATPLAQTARDALVALNPGRF
jgi:hypothetical protein